MERAAMKAILFGIALTIGTLVTSQAFADGFVCHHKVWNAGHYSCEAAEAD